MVTLGEPTSTAIDFGAAMRLRRFFSHSARGCPPGASHAHSGYD